MIVRTAGAADAPVVAALREEWAAAAEPGFAARLAAWLAAEGGRRTVWLATVDDEAAGMATMLEYRRMPWPGRADACWGYVANMFVREPLRGRGIGTALLDAVIAAADARGYVRLVLSPSERAVPFYARAGFVAPDERAAGDRLLVRPRRG